MGARGPQSSPLVGNVRPQATAFDLTGRVALITGASRGLGAAMAEGLAEAGADLVLWARDRQRLERQAGTLQQHARRLLVQPLDVTDSSAVRRAVRAALRSFKRIDVLINNAGIWDGDEALRLRSRQWARVVDTDLASVLFVSQAVAPTMIRRRYGKIINVASTAGIVALPHNGAYGTAKAGLIHLTRILAVEWGPYGIRVNGIAPGVFRTDMTRVLFADRRWSRARQSEIPLRRFGEPEDLKGLAVFLASRASDHLTGQTIIIDGGASLTT
ncbi:MAG: glucose 1-dehydrogenase [Candidatus Omnitrophica bacterium]|nr:glucose 1-dehydrogenase [Candidatus Omnitrophota bacterium]